MTKEKNNVAKTTISILFSNHMILQLHLSDVKYQSRQRDERDESSQCLWWNVG